RFISRTIWVRRAIVPAHSGMNTCKAHFQQRRLELKGSGMVPVLRSIAYIRYHWQLALLAFLSLVAATFFSLTVPQILKNVIDGGLPQPLALAIASPRLLSEGLQVLRPQPQLIFMAALLLLGLSLLRATVAFGQRFFGERLSYWIGYDIRNDFYNKVQHLPF